MDEGQRKAVETLSLPDDEYSRLDDDRLTALRGRLAAAIAVDPFSAPPAPPDADVPPLLALGAPRVVTLERRDDFPLLVAYRTTGQRDWEVSFPLNARVLLTDLRHGDSRTARLVVSHKRGPVPTPSGEGRRPDALNAGTRRIELEAYRGIRRRLDVPWHPGRHALTTLVHDRVSNTHVVELRSEEEVEPPAPPRPRRPSVAAKPIGAPAADALALDGPAEVGPEAPLALRIAGRLSAAEAVVVPAWDPDAPDHVSPHDVLLAGAVLVLRLDTDEPLLLEFAVPARRAGEQIETAFELDVRAALGERPLHPGEHQVYLVVGARVIGPRRLLVRDE